MVSERNTNLKNILTESNANISRSIPINVGAEQSLLGAILSNNLALEKVEDFLEPKHFSSKINSIIFDTLKRFITNNQIADITTIKVFLENNEDFVANGGMKYLLEIAENSVSIINAKQYGELIYDLYLRRELIDVGTELVNKSYSDFQEENSNSIIEKVELELFNLTNDGEKQRGPKIFTDVLSDTLDYAEKAFKKSSDVAVLKTALTDLDKKIGGLHKSDLIIIAGRPSMGKTALATNIAFHAAKKIQETGNKGSIAFFSLEMSSEQLSTRILAEQSRIKSNDIRRGKISEEQLEQFIETSKNISELPMYIDETPAISVAALSNRARRIKRLHGLDMIVIDYIQLMRATFALKEGRVQEISEITQGLKALAKELSVPVLALSQLSRAVEQRDDKKPLLSDLRESGSIEQDADVVMFVYRESYYLKAKEPRPATVEHAEWQAKMNEVSHLACHSACSTVAGLGS